MIASRLLHEPGGPASLLTRSSGGSLGTVRLTAAGGKLRGSPGGAQLGSPQGEPPMTLAMHHTSDGEPRLTLSMSRLAVARSLRLSAVARLGGTERGPVHAPDLASAQRRPHDPDRVAAR